MPDLSEVIEQALRWLEPFYERFGYLVVLLGALFEHLFFLAWAMPGGVLVALGGLYAQTGALSLPLVVLVGAVGFVLGDHLDYFVGRRGSVVLERLTKGQVIETSYIWSVRAVPALLLAYTNAIPRAAMFMGGAASGLTYSRFLALSLPLALVWSTIFSGLGYWLGGNRQMLYGVLRAVGLGGQGILVVVTALVLLFLWRRKRGRTEETART